MAEVDLGALFTNDVMAEVQRQIVETSRASIRQVIEEYVGESRRELTGELQKRMRDVNQATANAGFAEMNRSFATNPRETPSYRQGQGRASGGRLARAVANKGKHVDANSRRFEFFDMDYMKNAAPQWSRLTFGAGDVAGTWQPQPMRNPINGKVITASLSTFEAARAFTLPDAAGYQWFVKNGYEIHVGSGRGIPRVQTKGIVSEGWVQDGINVINDRYPGQVLTAFRPVLDPSDRREKKIPSIIRP